MMTRILLLAFVLSLGAGCRGAGRVAYVQGSCLIDGQTATLTQVEARQSEVTRRIMSRQPIFTLITLLVVLLAGASHAEKIGFLFSRRGREVKGLGERVKLTLDRYRAHPVRYFALVTTTLSFLLVAGTVYIYLDADKRASERALSMLQFCHLALRTAEEKSVLDEQRHNLATIQATAGDIRSLVDKLPPEEQRKAQMIVDQMGMALTKQGRIVGQYMQRADETTRDLRQHAATVERSLSTVEADVALLKALPGSMHELGAQLQRLDGSIRAVDGKLGASDGKLASLDGKLSAEEVRLATLEATMKSLAARPACAPCVCAGRATGADDARRAPDPPEERASPERPQEPAPPAQKPTQK